MALVAGPSVVVPVVLVVMVEPAKVSMVPEAVRVVVPEMVSGYGLVVRPQAGLRL